MTDFLVSNLDADNYQSLKDLFRGERPTIAFVGSGLSQNNGYVSWNTLVKRMASTVDVTVDGPEVHHLLKASGEVYRRYLDEYPGIGEARFREALIEGLTEGDHTAYHDSHTSLLRTNFSAFITTNFDPSIEAAARFEQIRLCSTVTYKQHEAFDAGLLRQSGIYHIHGRLWLDDLSTVPDPIVFLPQEYDIAYGTPGDNNGVVASFLSQVFQDYNLVFIGFGMRDPSFTVLMDRVGGNAAFRLLVNARRNPGGFSLSHGIAHWYQIVGIPDAGEYSEKQCLLEHSKDQLFTLIHYRYSDDGTTRNEWGLQDLLDDLSQTCPHGTRPSEDSSIAVLGPGILPPTITSEPIVPPVLPVQPLAPVTADTIPDLNQVLDQAESILLSDDPGAEQVEWLLGQLSETVVLDFVTRRLAELPDRLDFWISILFRARIFSVPSQVYQLGTTAIEPDWYGGRLLVVAAEKGHQEIGAILEAVQDCGPTATMQLVRAFLAISDPGTSASLVRVVERWIAKGTPIHLDFETPAFSYRIIQLLEAGFKAEAKHLMDILTDQHQGEWAYGYHRQAKSRVSQFWFDYMAKHQLPKFGERDSTWLVEWLESRLRRAVEWEFAGISAYAPPSFVPSPGFRQPIEAAGGEHDQFADQLVGALRDASIGLITSDVPTASGFITRWLSDRLLVFRRLAFHLLAEHGTEFGDLRQEAVRKEHLELADCYHEFRAFLKSQFRFLPESQQRQIEDWILSL